jgi:hypothetical protein
MPTLVPDASPLREKAVKSLLQRVACIVLCAIIGTALGLISCKLTAPDYPIDVFIGGVLGVVARINLGNRS